MTGFLGFNKRQAFGNSSLPQSSSDGLFKNYSDNNNFGNQLNPNWNLGNTMRWNELFADKYQPIIGLPFSMWSCARRLWSGYTGPLIQIRRTNDNAVLDIGFNKFNQLDILAISEFCKVDSGRVSILYDQSGRGNHFIQNSPQFQPFIYTQGLIELRNGLPSMFWNSSNQVMFVNGSTATYKFLHDSTDGSFEQYLFMVTQTGIVDNPNTNYWLLDNTNGGDASTSSGITWAYQDSVSNNLFRWSTVRSVSGSRSSATSAVDLIPANRLNVLGVYKSYNSVIPNIQRSQVYCNNNNVINNINSDAPSNVNAAANLQLGNVNIQNIGLIGYISELIIFRQSVFTNIRLNGIISDIGSYYNIRM
jgi:hypothetical protein